MPKGVRALPRPLTAPGYRLSTRKGCVLLFLSTLFTLAVVQYSLQYGRLIFAVPTYEDSRYVTDGMERLQEFYNHGPVAVLRSYFTNPPASPYSTALAAAGYAVFGLRDWAPYAMNGLLVLLLLLYLDRRLYGLGDWQEAVVLFFALLTPLPFLLVHEFRPDLACGLFTAVGMMMLVETPLGQFRGPDTLAAGVAWGLALFTKPSIFPGTLIFLGGAMAISAARVWAAHPGKEQWRRFARHGAALASVAALTSLPYFAAGLKFQTEYILKATVSSERQHWIPPGGLREHLLYYLTGPGGDQSFLSFGPVFATALVAGLVWVILQRERGLLADAGCAAAAIFLAYLVPTALPNKAFFGNATCAWLIMLYSVFAVGLLLAGPYRRRRSKAAAAVIVVLLVGAAGVRFRWSKWGESGNPYVRRSNEIMRETAHFLIEEARAGKRRVFFSTIGMHTDLAMRYLAMKEQFDPNRMTIMTAPFANTLDLYLDLVRKADIVLATEAGADLMPYPLPCVKYQEQVLRYLQQDPHFHLARRMVAASGKAYYLFERNPAKP
jgi:hypothetical protein